jgi:hypothetical protein
VDVSLGARGGSGVHFLARACRSELEFNMTAPTIGDFDRDKSFEGRIYDSRWQQKLVIAVFATTARGQSSLRLVW